jgi:5-epi-alpha-selinene synthase
VRRFGLLRSPEAADHYDSSRLGYLTSQIYPDAIRDRLLLISEWFVIWAMFDDQLEKLADSSDPSAVDVACGALLSWLPLKGPPAETVEVPFGAAFADAWLRMRELSSAVWQARFLRHTKLYLGACRWEAEQRRNATVPALGSYIANRRHFGGMRLAMDMSEFTGGYELSPEIHADPLIEELLDVLGDITLWGNDLFSIRVDREEGNVSNMVFVLQNHHHCDISRAIELTNAMLDERLRRLEQIEAGLDDWCTKRRLDATQRRDVLRFVEGVHTWISGNINWSTENARYRSARDRVSGDQPNFLLTLLRTGL